MAVREPPEGSRATPSRPLTVAPSPHMLPLPIYVRRGRHDLERVVRFPRPAAIPGDDLIAHGIALDGDRATFTVSECPDAASPQPSFRGPFLDAELGPAPCSLAEALLCAERGLTLLLGRYGLAPVFL